MAGVAYIKDAGSWKTVSGMWVKDAGIWKKVDKAWLKQSDVWREIYTSAFVFDDNISSYIENPVLKTRALAAGWDGVLPIVYNFNVLGTTIIGSSSTSTHALDTGLLSEFPSGIELTINIAAGAQILGRNGPGGGGLGGPAFRARFNCSVNNLGIMGGAGNGGANGGGGSNAQYHCDNKGQCSCGAPNCTTYGGSGGRGAGCLGAAQGGSSGSMGDCNPACGGSYSNGQTGRPLGDGACVVGNSFINWINTGTRYGSIS